MANKLYNDISIQAVADAIRQKNGSSDTYTVAQMAQAIAALSGETPEAPEDDVIYIDYDGKVLYSYSADDFLALTEHPANPAHAGLTAQGWNWTLADAQEYVRQTGCHCIGQMYTTEDGATYIYIDIPAAQGVKFCWSDSSVTVDWGDGSTPATASSSPLIHTYQPGSYKIKITPTGSGLKLGDGANPILTSEENTGNSKFGVYGDISRIHIGAGVSDINIAGLMSAYGLRLLTIPQGVSIKGTSSATMTNLYSLEALVLPTGATWYDYISSECCAKYVSIPKACTSKYIVYAGGSINAARLRRICFPATSVREGIWSYAIGLTRAGIPEGVTEIVSSAFNQCRALQAVTIPSTVTTIGSYCFYYPQSLHEIHMKPTTPPTIQSNSINNSQLYSGCKIYVPYSADHSILDAYKTATNWAAFADKMIEEDA